LLTNSKSKLKPEDLQHINMLLDDHVFKELKIVTGSDRRVTMHLIDDNDHGKSMVFVIQKLLEKYCLSGNVTILHEPIENVNSCYRFLYGFV